MSYRRSRSESWKPCHFVETSVEIRHVAATVAVVRIVAVGYQQESHDIGASRGKPQTVWHLKSEDSEHLTFLPWAQTQQLPISAAESRISQLHRCAPTTGFKLGQGYKYFGPTAAGVPGIAPHDLRRSFAQMCRASSGVLEQIQFLCWATRRSRPLKNTWAPSRI
jgi:hypothetical protein